MFPLSSITPLLLIIFALGARGFSPPRSSLSRSPALSDIAPHIADLANILLANDIDTSEAVSTLTDSSSAASEGATFLPTYSKASYYTTLALYVASFPGLWSQIKRSTKAKVKRKTYVR